MPTALACMSGLLQYFNRQCFVCITLLIHVRKHSFPPFISHQSQPETQGVTAAVAVGAAYSKIPEVAVTQYLNNSTQQAASAVGTIKAWLLRRQREPPPPPPQRSHSNN